MNRYQSGSNQYKKKSAPNSLTPLRVTALTQDIFKLCGEVWHTKCRAKVYAPSWAHSSHPSEKNKLRAALTAHTPTTVLLALANGDAFTVKYLMNRRAGLPEEVQQAIAMQHPLYAISKWGYDKDNPQLPQWLEYFTRHPSAAVRTAAARLPLPPHLCRLLTQDPEHSVRFRLIYNSSLPKPTQTILLHDPTNAIRSRALHQLGTPADITTDIVHHPEAAFRVAAAIHSDTPSQLDQLVRDTVLHVQNAAIRNPSTSTTSLSWVSKHSFNNVPHTIMTHPNCPSDFLSETMQYSPGWQIYISRHPKTPPHIIEQLVQRSNATVCLSIAQRPNLPQTTIERLSKHPTSRVRQSISQRSDLPTSIWDRLVRDRSKLLKEGLADRSTTPPHVLAKLVAAKTPRIRQKALKNPNCPASAQAMYILSL